MKSKYINLYSGRYVTALCMKVLEIDNMHKLSSFYIVYEQIVIAILE